MPYTDAQVEAIKAKRWNEIVQADKERARDERDPPRWTDGWVMTGYGFWIVVSFALALCLFAIGFGKLLG